MSPQLCQRSRRTARSIAVAAAVVVAGGCGKSDPASSRTAAAASATKPAVRWLECTEASRAPMEALLLARHHLELQDPRVEGLKCVTIQLAHQPAFFVELVASASERRQRMIGVLSTDGKTELVAVREANLGWAQQLGSKVWFETLDLDGDGADEVVVHHDDHRQQLAEWIDVIAIRDRQLVELAGPRIAYDDPDLDEHCLGALTREPVGKATHLVVTTTASTGASAVCLSEGRHVFALDAGQLVEVPGAPPPAAATDRVVDRTGAR